ncbi:MAG: NmrA/HSCARG family protein [Bacteroidetes bacterium]|nr:NmrA/HSCARG family protein [Bacteroidota bacterium]
MEKKIIAVIGSTGAQGKGVVEQLVKDGTFDVRALTRNPDAYDGPAQQVKAVDLNDYNSLVEAFNGAYGVFVVTNFWESADEATQGRNAVDAAKRAGVKHFIWSSLPDVEAISGGAFTVPHFTGKANVDVAVKQAGFEYSSIVQPPFYYQNFTGMLAPQPKEDGSTGWTLPLDPAKKVIHMGDISEFGKVVTGLFLSPKASEDGGPFSFSAELKSFDEVLSDYAALGQSYSYTQVPADTFATFFEGAKEIAEMLGYFEAHTYMGPDSDPNIKRVQNVAIGSFTSFADWIRNNA